MARQIDVTFESIHHRSRLPYTISPFNLKSKTLLGIRFHIWARIMLYLLSLIFPESVTFPYLQRTQSKGFNRTNTSFRTPTSSIPETLAASKEGCEKYAKLTTGGCYKRYWPKRVSLLSCNKKVWHHDPSQCQIHASFKHGQRRNVRGVSLFLLLSSLLRPITFPTSAFRHP